MKTQKRRQTGDWKRSTEDSGICRNESNKRGYDQTLAKYNWQRNWIENIGYRDNKTEEIHMGWARIRSNEDIYIYIKRQRHRQKMITEQGKQRKKRDVIRRLRVWTYV